LKQRDGSAVSQYGILLFYEPLEARTIASFYGDLIYWPGYNKVKEKEVK
jgi:hypothetical protein